MALFVSILLSLLAGFAVPLQAGTNARLGTLLGHPLWATGVSLLVSLLLPFFWQSPQWSHVLPLLSLGLLGMCGHQLLTQAFKRGGKPVRLLGIGVRLQDLRGGHEQLELFRGVL